MPSGPKRLLATLPFLRWPAQWRAKGLRGDVVAGISVGLVLVPQALAYAQLAGLPPETGLFAAVLPMIVGGLLGACAQLSTGPVALTALLTGASLAPLAAGGGDLLALAVLLALLSGLIQIGLGALGAGWLLNLLSRPVMAGFTNAAALVICLSQVPTMLGLAPQRSANFISDLAATLARLGESHALSVGYGLGALLALLLLRRLAPRLPGVLLVVIVGTAASAVTDFAGAGGAVVGALPAALPALALPVFDWDTAMRLLPAAFVIAVVSFMEVTASASVISARLGIPWQRNRELVAQGLAKLAAACSGALPVSASLSRSALNHAAGANTGLSSLISAGFVLLAMASLGPWLWHLPQAVLAAIILQVVAGLINPAAMRRAWRTSRDDGIAAAVTFVATLAFAPNIQNGILTGLMLSLALMLYRDMRPRSALLGLHPDGTYRDLERFGLPDPHPHIAILRFDGPLTFVTAQAFEDALLAAQAARRNIAFLVVSAAGINRIDASGLETAASLQQRLMERGCGLALCGLKKQVIDAMQRDGLWGRIGDDAGYRTEADALAALARRAARDQRHQGADLKSDFLDYSI